MGMRWSKERCKQHYTRYPADEGSERNRQAQARYRAEPGN
jgi:hypothetical protein